MMAHNKIFIEQKLIPELPIVDRKKELIQSQRIFSKRPGQKISENAGARKYRDWVSLTNAVREPKSTFLKNDVRKNRFFRNKFPLNNIRVNMIRGNRGRVYKTALQNQSAGPNVSLFRLNKRSLLLLFSCFLISISIVPLLIRFNSFVWEKKRILEGENDLLYNVFLLEGVDNEGADAGTGPNATADWSRQVAPPSLRVATYMVRPGDSLWSISQKFNVSIDTLLTANTVKNVHYLRVGGVLRIPNMSGVFYTVKRGDNLSHIATKYSVRVNEIADVNDLDSSTIHEGQNLFLPGASLGDWERASLMGTIFKFPTRGRITSRIGFRTDPFTHRRAYHTGVDIANSIGTPVYASQYGRVVYTGYKGNYGKTVIIAHPEGYRTLYAHLHKIYVKRGQAIRQGEKVGLLGNTGRSTGPHLHFEIHQNRKILDPLKIMRAGK